MLPAEGPACFVKGILAISSGWWMGQESKQLLAQFLPVVAVTLSEELMARVCMLVNFMYQAQATGLTGTDLDAMEEDLCIFHKHKCALVSKVFKNKGCFNKIAKLHMLQHWTHLICQLGTPDSYNTETPEQLHIGYAKMPWHASNKHEPLLQMVKYVQCQEAIQLHWTYLDQYIAEGQEEDIEIDQDATNAEDNVSKLQKPN